MELIQQQYLPDPVEFGGGIFRQRQRTPQRFGGGQQLFEFAVVFLGAGLHGHGAAMIFEVELTLPPRQFSGVLRQPPEEAVGTIEFELRRTFEIRQPAARSRYSSFGPPPPSPMPNRLTNSSVTVFSLKRFSAGTSSEGVTTAL